MVVIGCSRNKIRIYESNLSKQINKWAGDRRLFLAVKYQQINIKEIMELKKITIWQQS